MSTEAIAALLSDLDPTRTEREDLYRHFHRHPELSLQEVRTSARIRSELEAVGIEVHPVGRTGLVAIVENGPGPVVAMRADIDALPVRETSGKEYASTATQVDEATGETLPVSHACGHDFHLMSLITALQAYHSHRDAWSGTYVGVFQPAEETAAGARDLVEHDIAGVIPKPDVYLGQHVLSLIPAGQVGSTSGAFFTAAASIRVKVFGKGSHGSMPQLSVDPVVLAATIVTRLQSIVAREIAPGETAVVTVGSIHSGIKSNIIPDDAEIRINTRAYDKDVESHLHEAIERIIRAECQAARSPREPEIEYYDIYPLTENHEEPYRRVRAAFDAHFGRDSVDIDPVSASEDFSIVPDALGVPYFYWGLGGFADMAAAPGNHNPAFAPDLQPTLDRGAEAAIVAASAWLLDPPEAD